jgi:hypothetical protein
MGSVRRDKRFVIVRNSMQKHHLSAFVHGASRHSITHLV